MTDELLSLDLGIKPSFDSISERISKGEKAVQFENGPSEIPLKFLGLLLRVGAQRTAEIDSECHWAESVIILQNMGLFIFEYAAQCTLKCPQT